VQTSAEPEPPVATDPVDDEDLATDEFGGTEEPARRRFGTAWLAAAVVVGLLLGFAAGWLVPRLTLPGDDSPEAGFARDMTTHHAQAVEMGLIAWQRAESPTVRSLGVDIATGQQSQIGAMQAWLKQWHLDPTGSQPQMAWMPEGRAALGPDGLMPGLANGEQMTKLRTAKGRELDILFLQLMIRHHLGGIHMVDGILAKTDDAEVVEAAQTMKANQQTELNNLQAELTRLGGTLLPTN
jgi:uncharacterized protein (DUF305 family)